MKSMKHNNNVSNPMSLIYLSNIPDSTRLSNALLMASGFLLPARNNAPRVVSIKWPLKSGGPDIYDEGTLGTFDEVQSPFYGDLHAKNDQSQYGQDNQIL
ncbi:MAG: hypothetical protein RIG77_08745 [Cyclobacteriaceae bacterium]